MAHPDSRSVSDMQCPILWSDRYNTSTSSITFLGNRYWLLTYSVIINDENLLTACAYIRLLLLLLVHTAHVPVSMLTVGKASQLDPCPATGLRNSQLGRARAVYERRCCIRDEMANGGTPYVA